jgi:hypothetical protein
MRWGMHWPLDWDLGAAIEGWNKFKNKGLSKV